MIQGVLSRRVLQLLPIGGAARQHCAEHVGSPVRAGVRGCPRPRHMQGGHEARHALLLR